MSKEVSQKIIKHQYSSETGRIGIVGGTFDPIHYAHLHMAEVAKEECDLDEIWFIPAQLPPHKQGKQIGAAEDRIALLLLAIESIPYFRVSLVEYEREIGVPSYTFETMEKLVKLYPHVQFYFIIGADMVEYLPEWHRIDELTKLVTFVGVGRPGWAVDQQHLFSHHVLKVEMVQSTISSSIIRQRVKKGKSIRFLVPEKVHAYIKEHHLYE